jgi:hypothetical protein
MHGLYAGFVPFSLWVTESELGIGAGNDNTGFPFGYGQV